MRLPWCARQAEKGRLERRLYVPTPGRKRAAHGRAGMTFMRLLAESHRRLIQINVSTSFSGEES